MAEQQSIPQIVPLQGVPTGWHCDSPQHGIVLMLMSTPVGTSVYHFSDRDVDKLIESLKAAQARSRLLLPPSPN